MCIITPKGGFRSDAIEEPMWVPQRIFQCKILKIIFLLIKFLYGTIDANKEPLLQSFQLHL